MRPLYRAQEKGHFRVEIEWAFAIIHVVLLSMNDGVALGALFETFQTPQEILEYSTTILNMSSHNHLRPVFSVVVVGCGLGGMASALALAEAGHQVAVIERSPELQEVKFQSYINDLWYINRR